MAKPAILLLCAPIHHTGSILPCEVCIEDLPSLSEICLSFPGSNLASVLTSKSSGRKIQVTQEAVGCRPSVVLETRCFQS